MEYELYIDVFFLENFMMDHLLLLLVGRILKSSATPGRTALGALAGSALFCAAVAAPLPCPVIKFFVFHAGISTAMLRLALRVPWGRQMARALGILYGAGFLLGGILSSLSSTGRSWRWEASSLPWLWEATTPPRGSCGFCPLRGGARGAGVRRISTGRAGICRCRRS